MNRIHAHEKILWEALVGFALMSADMDYDFPDLENCVDIPDNLVEPEDHLQKEQTESTE